MSRVWMPTEGTDSVLYFSIVQVPKSAATTAAEAVRRERENRIVSNLIDGSTDGGVGVRGLEM